MSGEPDEPTDSARRRVLVAHFAAQHSYQTALALQEAGLLREYITGSFYFRNSGPLALVVRHLPGPPGERLRRLLLRRHLPGLDGRLVRSWPREELQSVARMTAPRLVRIIDRNRPYPGRIDRFQERVASHVRETRPGVVIAYDAGARLIFEAARSVGATCVLDQTTGHITTALRTYADAGIPTMQTPDAIVGRKQEEARSADLILAPSQFVRDTLTAIGVPPERIAMVPYGVDTDRFVPASRPAESSGTFRALFVGRLTQLKGVQYVLRAFRRAALPDAELHLVGQAGGDRSWVERYGPSVVYHPPLPPQEIHRVYQPADVFVHAALHEGSALTVFEALAAGLPVITTPNSGSVVRDGVEGFIVPAADVPSLAERLRLLHDDRELRIRMGRAARARAEEFTWGHYRRRLAEVIQAVVSGSPVSSA